MKFRIAGAALFLSLVVTMLLGLSSTFANATDILGTNATPLSIPDDGWFVSNDISISAPTNAVITGIDVHFSSDHQRSKDIEVFITNGYLSNRYYLWNHEGGTSPNPTRTTTGISQFNGLNANGFWNLYVRDTAYGSTGSITEWSIRVYYTTDTGTGYQTYKVTSSVLPNLTIGHDENGDGYFEDYQFVIASDYQIPDGKSAYSKIKCNTTGQQWVGGLYSRRHNVLSVSDDNFSDYIKNNSDLTFTEELWDDATYSHTLLASTTVSGVPIKAGPAFYTQGYVNTWNPITDNDSDGYYDTYQFELAISAAQYATNPISVLAKIICVETGQVWWSSTPFTVSTSSPYQYFDFSDADFAGYITGNTTLNFIVELWDPTKTTKLDTARSSFYDSTEVVNFYNSALQVDSSPCSVAITNFTASSSLITPYTGGNTNFTADIVATPSATWRLTINNEDVAAGNINPVSQAWYGKNALGQILDPETYTAILTATDPSGLCTDSKSIAVTVDRKAPPPTNSCEVSKDVPIGSTTNITTGDVDHNQTLFGIKGAALSTNIELFYNSLNPYTGPLGKSWSHTYDISVTENTDGSILLREGIGGRSLYIKSGSTYVSPAGDFSTLVKNGNSTYVITYRDGHIYNFRTDGKINSIVDRFSNSISFAYPNGDLYTVTDPAQRVTTFEYDTTVTPHRITKVTDPNLKTYDFSYQGTNCSNELCRVTNPVADPVVSPIRGYWEYQYDAQGFLKSKRDPQNNLTQYNYYADHRLQSAIDPEGVSNPTNHTRSIVYPTTTGTLRTTTVTEKDGGQWLYTYDSQAGVLKQKTAHNTTTNDITNNYTFYPSGYLKSKTEPKDGTVRLTTFYTYDSYGNILTQTDPVDLSIYSAPNNDPETIPDPSTLANLTPPVKPAFRYAYDYANFDQIQSISNERSTPFTTTTYQYSTVNGFKVTTITDPDMHATTYRYNTNGTLKDITDANTKTVSFDYYSSGLLNTFTDLNGVISTFSKYDNNGNVLELKIKDTNNKELTTSFTVDTLNRLTKTTRLTAAFPDNITQFVYNLNSNRTSIIDAEKKETKYEYRYDNQVTKITDAKLKDTRFTYGPTGCPSCGGGQDKLSSIADAKQHSTSYFYDQLGRLEHETDPLNKSIRYTYYDCGKVKDKIDSSSVPEKILITYTYDNLGRLTKKHYNDGSEETYSFDTKGNLQTATNQNIGYTFDYYANGWLKSVTDSTGKVISYDLYDSIGQRKQVTFLKGNAADQRQITYDYDSANRLHTITSPAGIFTYNYDEKGRRWTLTYPGNNPVIATYGYDDLDRLTSLTHGVSGNSAFLDYGYTHDQVGNRKTRTGTSPQSYNYDEVYQLLQAVTTNGIENYTYDEVGNRKTGPGFKDTAYLYNEANQVTTGRKLQYAYDNYGNQNVRIVPNAPEKSWTQEWDFENRLIKTELIKGSERKTVTFKYDPLGRRIEKKIVTIIGGVTKTSTYSYVYDNQDIVQETLTTDIDTTKTYYTHGPGIDEHLALERSGNFFYYHVDGLGSITAITDATKQVVQSYDYDSFGLVKPSTNFASSYTFTGREWDKETGLMHYRGRSYDMREGKFLSKDPISYNGGINLYGYVSQNPINFTDPLGLSPLDRVKWAYNQLNYNRDFWKGSFPRQNKCNEFVASAHSSIADPDAGDYPSAEHCGIFGCYNAPTTSDLANPNFARDQLDYLSVRQVQPGDIVVWYGGDVHHAAIYVGDGKVIYQNADAGVKVNDYEAMTKKWNVIPIVRRYLY